MKQVLKFGLPLTGESSNTVRVMNLDDRNGLVLISMHENDPFKLFSFYRVNENTISVLTESGAELFVTIT